jgi:transcription elongation factor GreA
MIDNKRIYLTKAKFAHYVEDLEYMKTVVEFKLAKLLSDAPSSGMGRPHDLPIHEFARNFYDEQGRISSTLGRALLIDDYVKNIPDLSIIDLGAKVSLEDIDFKEEEVFFILGPDEVDPRKGRISYESSLGAALLGKRTGDIVSSKPGGARFKVTRIEYPPLDFVYEPTNWDDRLATIST